MHCSHFSLCDYNQFVEIGMEITSQRAREFNIEGQREGESDTAFRSRVAGSLREAGCLIEAHEAFTNALYDDPEGGAMTGIFGALAQAFQGRDYGARTGYDQIGDDIAAGTLAQEPDRSMSPEMALLMIELFGGR